MKKIILLFITCLCATGLFAQANPLNNQVERAVATATHTLAAQASISLTWAKPVYMSDVMMRRPRGENVIIRWDHTTTVCTGTVSDEGRIYFVADCLKPGSFEIENLKKMKVSLTNGVQLEGGLNNIELPAGSDVAWVLVSKSVLTGLPQLPVLHTPKGQSLQGAYGESMTRKLQAFYNSKNIPQRTHSCRIGYRPTHTPKVSVGDPVIIDGKLTALMQEVPSSYGGWLGGVSESALAIIH